MVEEIAADEQPGCRSLVRVIEVRGEPGEAGQSGRRNRTDRLKTFQHVDRARFAASRLANDPVTVGERTGIFLQIAESDEAGAAHIDKQVGRNTTQRNVTPPAT